MAVRLKRREILSVYLDGREIRVKEFEWNMSRPYNWGHNSWEDQSGPNDFQCSLVTTEEIDIFEIMESKTRKLGIHYDEFGSAKDVSIKLDVLVEDVHQVLAETDIETTIHFLIK